MKILTRIFGVCIALILTSMVFLETMNLTIRQDELNNCISTAVTTTQIVMKENIEDAIYGTDNARQKITSNEDYLKLFKRNLDELRTTNSKYDIKVYGVDYSKGYIDVGVESTYPMFNGETKTITGRQTNLIEVYKSGEQIKETYGHPTDTFAYSVDYDYTGSVQTWTVPKSGQYKIEAWGASSGNSLINEKKQYTNEKDSNGNKIPTNVGFGGYSVGYINIDEGEKLYISVGGQGQDGIIGKAKGGWNGGGDGDWDRYDIEDNGHEASAGGGGATSVTNSLISDGQLKNYANQKDSAVVLVAGGGGSGGSENYSNSKPSTKYMHAGGVKGNNGGIYEICDYYPGITANAKGGTQTSGYRFGEGQTAVRYANLYENSEVGAGGGGWYGGFSCTDSSNAMWSNGAGGSGYIGYSELTDGKDTQKHMAGYHVATSDDESTKTISVDKADRTAKADTAKIGNGFVRITYIPEEGSSSYVPLLTLVKDNDGDNKVSPGDLLETTADFYSGGATVKRPGKFVCLSVDNGYAQLMSTDSYKFQKFNANGSEVFDNGVSYLKYDGSKADKALNGDFYNSLSDNTKKALKQVELTQTCYEKSSTQLTDSDIVNTTIGGNVNYISKQASVLVGQHSKKAASYEMIGNKKYIYLPDIEDLADVINNGKLNQTVFNKTIAPNRVAWTRSVSTDGNVIAIEGANAGVVKVDDNIAGYELHPTFTIDSTAIVLGTYRNWGTPVFND